MKMKKTKLNDYIKILLLPIKGTTPMEFIITYCMQVYKLEFDEAKSLVYGLISK